MEGGSRSHAKNENKIQTSGHRGSVENIEKHVFKIMKLGMLSWSSINMSWYFFVPFGAGLGICFSQTRASHNKPDGFGRERPTFGDEMISTTSYCCQIIISCQHWTIGVLCEFLWFFGLRLDIFMHWLSFRCIRMHNSNLNYMHML